MQEGYRSFSLRVTGRAQVDGIKLILCWITPEITILMPDLELHRFRSGDLLIFPSGATFRLRVTNARTLTFVFVGTFIPHEEANEQERQFPMIAATTLHA